MPRSAAPAAFPETIPASSSCVPNLSLARFASLTSAWNSFEAAVKDVPDDASVQDAVNDVKEAADDLESEAESTASSVDCPSDTSS